MDIHASLAIKLLAGYGRDDLSTMLALGLRNLVLSIETTERRRKDSSPSSSSSLTTPFDDENKFLLSL